jgi:hypothetical protein
MANLRAKIEIDVVVNEVSYLAYIPQGVPFVDALAAIDEMKAVVEEWQKRSVEEAEKTKQAESIEPEVVS